jgi:hypothetical protein
MSRVVLDEELRTKLAGGHSGVEFTDEAGNVVGHYLPHGRYVALLDAVIPPVTPEERDEAIREVRDGKGLSTADILEAIESAKREWAARR